MARLQRPRAGLILTVLGVGLAVGLTVGLSACSASVSVGNATPVASAAAGGSSAAATDDASGGDEFTIPSDEFAGDVRDLLAKQVGKTPTVDCGTADIPISEGEVVHCDISDPSAPDVVYDSATTISNVHGSDFHVDTKVADTPKS